MSRSVVDLLIRQIDLRLADALEAAHLDVADDADDGATVEGEAERLTDRIAAGQGSAARTIR